MRLGCVADDYTGAADVATALRRAGCDTMLHFGTPEASIDVADADAVVVGLRIRTAPAQVAVRMALHAHAWLACRGAEQIYFKYCSTFDSTDAGNIGPIADALAATTETPLTVVCPAAPEHGRTVYQGHLFVGSVLLSDTSMRDHPLTPMRDSSVIRTLARQTDSPVASVPHEYVRQGADAVAERLSRLRWRGVRYAVVDALSEHDLRTVAEASASLRLVTGAAGLAASLGRAYGSPAARAGSSPELALPEGTTAILAGSCSATTIEQVAHAARELPAYRVAPTASTSAEGLVSACVGWLDDELAGASAALIHSSAPPGERSARDAPLVERVMGGVARALAERGVRRFVVAGGETAAAVLDALEVRSCRVGPEEARGVPWLISDDERRLALLLKSGNLGDPKLFIRASERQA